MRNLKRALSLGLTAAMISGLMVMGSSAASYADVTSEDNVEAIEVLESVGIMIGDESGNFNPDQNVTRNEMAVVMANLMEYNVASYKDTSPFTDVPSWAEPYVAACWTNGITAGYSDTIYGGSDTVTTAQAALMLMKALGYFQYASDFGGDWQLATTRQGNAIDLFTGVDSGVTQAMTRNDVAQLVLNTLRSGTVEASTDGSWTIGDVTINNNVTYSYITSNADYADAIDDVRSTSNTTDANRSIVELGEQLYQGDLKLNDNTDDDFMRPSRTWSYDGKEIGTYAKRELQIATYTTGVTGREMYDLLSAATIRDNELLNYVDGVAGTIEKNDLVRANDDDLDDTGNGVLTEVYLDDDRDEITVVSINTWLAQANANYNETSESLSLNVFENDADGVTKIVDVEEVPEIADVAEDQFVLVNMTWKDRSDGEVVAVSDPEILENSTVTKFSQNGDDVNEGFFTKLTVDGTEYEAAEKAEYDDEVLNLYDATLLTDMSYNVYLDQYGYAIGVDLYEGEMNYVFIAGYDRGQSYISIKTADAAAIFTDGTMDAITVNVTDTTKNIEKLDDNNDGIPDDPYYREWNNAGDVALNRWYSYTVTSNDIYTLKPIEGRMLATQYDFDANNDGVVDTEYTINCSNVRLEDNVKGGANGRAFGNDDSVYITVEAGEVDMSGGLDNAITEVNSLYTGVQDVDIEITDAYQADVAEASVYTLKDKDDYVIASIVLGEAQGSTANYAFILTDAKSEGIEDGEYMWEFDAVLNGVKQTLTARSKYPSTISDLDVGEVQELRFDGDYVVGVKDIEPGKGQPNSKFVTSYTTNWDDEEVYDVNYNSNETLDLKGRTLQSATSAGADNNDQGWTIASTSMPTVLRHKVNGSTETINYSSMGEALAAAGDALPNTDGKQFDGRIVMVLNDQGVAQWAFIESDTPVTTGQGGNYTDNAQGVSAEAYAITGGRARVTFDIDWPAYAVKADGVKITYDLYVNGKLVLDNEVANGGSVITGNTYTEVQPWVVDDSSDVVEVELVDVEYQNMYVRYFDADTGKEIAKTTGASGNFVTAPTDDVAIGTSKTITFRLNTTSEDDIQYQVMQSGTARSAKSSAAPANQASHSIITYSTAADAITDTAYVDVMIYGLEAAEEYVTLKGFNSDLGVVYPAWSGKLGASTKVQLSINTAGTTGATSVPAGSEVELIFKTASLADTVNKGLVITMGDGNGWTWDVVIPNNGGSIRETTTIKPTEDMNLTVINVKTVDIPEITSVKLNDEFNGDGKVNANETITLNIAGGPVDVDGSKITATDCTIASVSDANGVTTVTITVNSVGSGGSITVAAGALTDVNGLQNVATTITIPASGAPSL